MTRVPIPAMPALIARKRDGHELSEDEIVWLVRAFVTGERTVEGFYVVRDGVDAAIELLTAMERADADLLVIGIKHRSPVGKLLLGSVSQRVLLECPKPVLAVKPAE